MTKLTFVVSLLVALAAADPFIRYINELQSPTGGFHELGVEAEDLHTTAQALFLTSLYGVKSLINADDALNYVRSLATSEGGYSNAAQLPASLEATRDALLAHVHLGKPVPDAEKVSGFILSLANVNDGTFASRAGESGDYKSTALAVEALKILGESDKPVVQQTLQRVKDRLSAQAVEESGSLHFAFGENSASPLADNYFGLVLAKQSGFVFQDTDKWVSYITKRQDLDSNSPTYGGFYGGSSKDTVSAEATAYAALSLALLGSKVGDELALSRFVAVRKSGLVETAQSHLAFAHSSTFKSSITTRVVYDSSVELTGEDQVMEGTLLRPRVWVTVLDGRIPHGGFDVVGTSSTGVWESGFQYDPSHYSYTSANDLDTTGKLGPVEFSFELKTNVYPIGEISLSAKDTKKIGYAINVDTKATLGEREFEIGSTVVAGTEFEFEITLATKANPSFTSGSFLLDVSVLDASAVSHFKKSWDGSKNNDDIDFKYTLTGKDFPSGSVSFQIQVRDPSNNLVHSEKTVSFLLDQHMVASNIVFNSENNNYRVGEKVVVSIEPASLADLRTTVPFSAESASKHSYKLVLTSREVEVLSVAGSAVDGAKNAQYKFEFQVPATLDVLGTSVVSFQYVGANGEEVTLLPFDSSKNEAFENADSLQLTVASDVHVSDSTKSVPQSARFGETVSLSFKLTDRVSGKQLTTGKFAELTAAIVTSDRKHESVRVVAKSDDSSRFNVDLLVDGNAYQGSNLVVIEAHGQDKQTIAVLSESSSSAASYPLTVSGKISASTNVFSTKGQDATRSSFVVSFGLTAEETQATLKNTGLVASVFVKGQNGLSALSVHGNENALANLPVAFDENGKYSFSFVAPHSDVRSGDYTVKFFRVSDLTVDSKAAALFEVSLHHKSVETSGSVLQLELLTVVVFVGFYVAISSHSRNYKQKRN